MYNGFSDEDLAEGQKLDILNQLFFNNPKPLINHGADGNDNQKYFGKPTGRFIFENSEEICGSGRDLSFSSLANDESLPPASSSNVYLGIPEEKWNLGADH